MARQKKERDRYKTIVTKLESQLAANQQRIVDLSHLQEYCDTVQGVIDDFGFEEKRLAVEALGVKVYATHDNYRLDVLIIVKQAIGLDNNGVVSSQSTEVVSYQKIWFLIRFTPTPGLLPLL